MVPTSPNMCSKWLDLSHHCVWSKAQPFLCSTVWECSSLPENLPVEFLPRESLAITQNTGHGAHSKSILATETWFLLRCDFFLSLLIYFETDRESVTRGGAEREGEPQAGSSRSVHRIWCRAQSHNLNREIMTWAKIKSWDTQPTEPPWRPWDVIFDQI